MIPEAISIKAMFKVSIAICTILLASLGMGVSAYRAVAIDDRINSHIVPHTLIMKADTVEAILTRLK